LPFAIVEAKVLVPDIQPGALPRTPLVNRLRATTNVAVVSVVAPAGYGKTTLLAQWANRDQRPFAWVSVDDRDNDPVVLLRHVAASFGHVFPVDRRVLAALRSPSKSIWPTAVPRLLSAMSAFDSPFVLVLDGVDELHDHDAVDAVSMLAEHFPQGSMLVVAGRVPPHLPIARLRACGRVLELGATELALNGREARVVLQSAGLGAGDAETDEIVRRTEGWAAGLYLAGLAFQQDDSAPDDEFTGSDRYLADYVRSEYLSKLTPKRLSFLRRTSHLDRMCAPLCDAVLERTDSARELAAIERSNLFLVPLDRNGKWFRYHHLFHDLLKRELSEREPELADDLNRRAADWFEANGDLETALGHAHLSGDTARAARILTSIALPTYFSGRVEIVEGWFERFDDAAALERFPNVAAQGSQVHALRGRASEADRWLAAAEAGVSKPRRARGKDFVGASIAVLRAAMCRDGADQMLADAQLALTKLEPSSQWLPSALLMQGVAHVLLGENECGDAILATAAETAQRLGSTETRIVAIGERVLIAASRGDHAAAEDLSLQAHRLVEAVPRDAYATNALELAVSARGLLRTGRWQEARVDLAAAQRLTPFLTHALPWLAVQTRLELAHAYLAMRDYCAAKALLVEIGQILARRPQLGVLTEQAAELDRELMESDAEDRGKATGLTDAELRVLPLLATHLSFREIGERLYVSRNTIKTQAISVYRKLGVSSRSDAVERAGTLGLVDAASGDFTRQV
jgi:LuxR family maltose regulon positive regulatory protein